MIKAANISTRSRRKMLAGASSALLCAVAGRSKASASAADRELLALCAYYERTEAELDDFYENVIEPDPGNKAAYEFWNAELSRLFQQNTNAFDLVLPRPVETLEGLAAKAKVLTVNIDRTEPSLGNEVTISDKRLEMAYALARNAMKLATVQS